MSNFFLIFLMYLSLLLMSYGAAISPVLALLGSMIIAGFAWINWRAEWKNKLGLSIPPRDAVLAMLSAPVLMILFYGLIVTIAAMQDITYLSPVSKHGLLSAAYLHTLGQTLNEEMLFGALILFALQRRIGSGRSLQITLVVALIFALLHYVFYCWIVVSENRGVLTLAALFVLFAIGVARNSLILKANHIAYAWSLHFSINMIGLVGVTRFLNGTELTEPQVLNRILGSPYAVLVSVVVLTTCGIFLLAARSNKVGYN
jgi:membrane protease YdiL (CAAX protease family)